MSASLLLSLHEVRVRFPLMRGWLRPRQVGEVRAVDGVSLEIREGEIFGLVGESGSGKSTLARALVGLQPAQGQMSFAGQSVALDAPEAFRALRPQLQMVFQDPYASLNPRLSVQQTLEEALACAPGKRAATSGAGALLEQVGLARSDLHKYPHQFSGGQRQRIAIARALAPGPRLLVADEPVSALDVSIQAQILNLLLDLRRDLGLSLLFISHDLAVVRYLADRMAVMQQGQIVETGSTAQVMAEPQHPYTRKLLSAALGESRPGVAIDP